MQVNSSLILICVAASVSGIQAATVDPTFSKDIAPIFSAPARTAIVPDPSRRCRC